MHPSLRPELRGAQRILRSIRNSPSASSHWTVRSFASYRRLQAQTPSSNSTSPPGPNSPNDGRGLPESIPQRLQDIIKAINSQTFPPSPQGQHDNASPEPSISEVERQAQDWHRRAQQESKINFQHLGKGEIPPGYKLINDSDLKDLPASATKDLIYIPDTPFLIAEDPSKHLKIFPAPRGFQQLSQTKEYEGKEQVNTSTQDSQPNDSNAATRTNYYGSTSARRKRARESKPQAQASLQMPSWFLENNISLRQSPNESVAGVVAVSQLSDGSYVPVSSVAGYVEAVKVDANQAPASGNTEPLEQAHGPPSDEPKPDDGHRSPLQPPTHDVQNHVTLSDSRYFIEQAQHQELLNTFRGRLHPPAANGKTSYSPLALNHLTINHSSKDADKLLDTLVTDLCQAAGADRIRIDIQDISDLIAHADVDPSVADKGGRLSFKIYNTMFAPASPYEENMFPVEEEEDDGNDDDDAGPPEISFGLSSPMSGGIPRGLISDINRSLNAARGPMIQFLAGKSGSKPSVMSTGLFGSLVDSLVNSAGQSRSKQETQQSDESTTTQSEDSADVPPLVIHLPNYRALQNHQLSEAFLNDVLENVSRRNRRIMVVGTDCVRDESTQKAVQNDPRYILEEQNNKSFGLSSNILLTPVFPGLDAEMALLKDREQRIRTINARHLWVVLQAKGVSLKGLEAGFWSKDFSQDIGKDDWESLGERFWPFLQVQRVAALIAGADSNSAESPISEALTTIALSDQSKVAWAKRSQPVSRTVEAKEVEQPANKALAKIRSKASRHEKKLLSGVIEPNKIATTFKDIHIPAETIEALQTLTTLSLVRPEAFRYGVLKSDRIPGLLLYGPPGTGKTLAAKAVAKESGATMLEVSAADLNDMYVGEGEKNVQALFSLAKKLSPCVVFLDEADAMFSARSAQGRRVSHRELLNQFLKEWDGMSNDSGSAFIMVATNRPMDLDDAVLRRLPRRLLVDLPTEHDRLEILRIHLRHETLSEEVNLSNLAKKTPFYSGSDLKNVAVAAALNAVREENEAAKQYRLNNPNAETPYEYPEKRVLTENHFEKALEEISASISEDMSSLKEIKKFDEQFGDRKGRKKKAPRWGFKSASDADRVLETVKVRS